MEKQATLKIYKASAGSGKTFRLVVEYLKLIVENPPSYANILAVTFTNKATTEMKSRILTELFGIAHGLEESQSYAQRILEELQEKDPKWTISKIKNQAQTALNMLLHDYSRFRIETIDSFFQSVLRNLAKELGLGAYMNVELDAASILSDAVKAMLGKVKEDPDLLQWISDYIDEKVADGSNWKLNRELEDFGGNIFKEEFKGKEKELRMVLQDKNFLKTFRKTLSNRKEEKIGKIIDSASRFRIETDKSSIKTEDFLYGNSGVAGYFNKIIDKKDVWSEMGARAIKCLESPENWVKKDSVNYSEITALASNSLMQILQQTENIRQKNIREINSCELILKHINNVGLLYDIAETVRELNAENNRFMLADTPNLLQELIQGNDAPFIYEKIGASLQNIMIDEFQDTSRVQWENFKPLLLEGLAQNADSIIVGDQKQSIYRWRNGDWRMLGNLKRELPKINISELSLDINWRSEHEIIRFNNRIFEAAIPLFRSKEGEEYPEMRQAYSDVAQKCPKEKCEGYVKADFFYEPNSEFYQTTMLERLIDNVEELQSKGVAAEDITILVRKNKTIPLIAEYLSNYQKEHPEKPYKYNVVSDQAYRLEASLAIHILIEALRYISEPQNRIYKTQLLLSYQTEIKKKDAGNLAADISLSQSEETKQLEEKLQNASLLPLYELIEELYAVLELHTITEQESYLYSFLDGVNDFLLKKSSDIASFLVYWDESLKNKTIPFSSEIEGMRIMSVHKSKGLEFHTVIIPFCDWTLTYENNLSPLLWTSSEIEPFDALPLFPVKYGGKMEDSIFEKEFHIETEQLWVDNLNLLYVALTRAEKNLILIGKDRKPDEKDNKSVKKAALFPSNVSELLLQILESAEEQEFQTCWDQEARKFISGTIFSKKEAKKVSTNKLNKKPSVLNFSYFSHPQKARFKQSNRSREFIEEREENARKNYIDRGKLLHYLFAKIQTVSDIPGAINQLFFEGIIQSETEKQELTTYVSDAIQSSEVSEWFKKGVKLFNECNIIYRDEMGITQSRRPDRVIQTKEKMIVVDFKFGKEYNEHASQVKEYIDLLQQMGYSAIEGFLWYVEERKIKKLGNHTNNS